MDSKHVLLVEGPADMHALRHLLNRHMKRAVQPEVKHKGGVRSLLDGLEVEIDAPNLERLGIVVDADTNVAARWQAIRDRLLRVSDFKWPDKPALDGTIVPLTRKGDDALITIGIWMMPDNSSPGSLETFIQSLIPSDQKPLWERAKQSVNAIPEEERLFKSVDNQKAYIHTWLAWQQEPGIPIGHAIKNRLLDANTPHALKLIEWIRRLFAL